MTEPRPAATSPGLAPALAPAELRWVCAPVRASRERAPRADLVGQERPLRALRIGLELRAPGYNVFVTGVPGTGRTTLVEHLIRELRGGQEPGPDRLFLNDFRDPHRPILLTLPRGQGPEFQRDLEDLLLRTQDALRTALTSRPHKMSRRLVVQNAEQRQRRLHDALARLADQHGCALVHYETQSGLAAEICPVHEGEAVSQEALVELVSEGRLDIAGRDELLQLRTDLEARLEEVQERARRELRNANQELRAMDCQVARRVVVVQFREFRLRWPQPVVASYLQDIAEWIENDTGRWAAEPETEGALPPDAEPPPSPLLDIGVHVIKTTQPGAPCPVVVEYYPTYTNLFGSVVPAAGGLAAHLSFHCGAMLRADGGFLVMRASDVLTEPGVWAQLKRTLKSGRLEIREFDASAGAAAGMMQPEAIPIDLKVVLIGEPGTYEHLAAEDNQFLPTFKVHAEFDASVENSAENRQRYADFLAALADDEGLRAFSPDANAALLEFAARRAGRRDRLSTSFGELADVGREASLLCERGGQGPVRREHVGRALRLRDHRNDLVREQIERDLEHGYLMLETAGEVVGQINGLTVLESGPFAFGKPCRITAATGAGRPDSAGVVNIEREAELSGPLHDKGVLILAGYLLDRFGADGPLCLAATLCFEQSYGGVDGDSASGAELLALLSSLARVPLDQALAMTGSINQHGRLQAVSAVNEKIEGYYRLCAARGLSGEQGAVIPTANIGDLMLDPEIVDAVRAGRFRIHATDSVDGALELLTGRGAAAVLQRAAATLRGFRSQVLREEP